MIAYIVDLYAEGREIASDCWGDFIATPGEADEIGNRFVAECKASFAAEGENVWNWPVRYTVRAVDLNSDEEDCS